MTLGTRLWPALAGAALIAAAGCFSPSVKTPTPTPAVKTPTPAVYCKTTGPQVKCYIPNEKIDSVIDGIDSHVQERTGELVGIDQLLSSAGLSSIHSVFRVSRSDSPLNSVFDGVSTVSPTVFLADDTVVGHAPKPERMFNFYFSRGTVPSFWDVRNGLVQLVADHNTFADVYEDWLSSRGFSTTYAFFKSAQKIAITVIPTDRYFTSKVFFNNKGNIAFGYITRDAAERLLEEYRDSFMPGSPISVAEDDFEKNFVRIARGRVVTRLWLESLGVFISDSNDTKTIDEMVNSVRYRSNFWAINPTADDIKSVLYRIMDGYGAVWSQGKMNAEADIGVAKMVAGSLYAGDLQASLNLFDSRLPRSARLSRREVLDYRLTDRDMQHGGGAIFINEFLSEMTGRNVKMEKQGLLSHDARGYVLSLQIIQ